jgi:hypothetical protein
MPDGAGHYAEYEPDPFILPAKLQVSGRSVGRLQDSRSGLPLCVARQGQPNTRATGRVGRLFGGTAVQ